MAAVVAYYLSEAAPQDERKEAVTTADIAKYFKQANYRVPTRIRCDAEQRGSRRVL
jgi:hypothetical protein